MQSPTNDSQYFVCNTCNKSLFYNFFRGGSKECIICNLRKQEAEKEKKEKSFVPLPNSTAY